MDSKEQIKQLWKTCFDDSDEFIRFFFDQIYNEKNVVSIKESGKVVSVMQILPYEMTWCNTIIPVSYVYAACTAPEMRNRGLMGKLIEKAHKQMLERGDCMSILIPANSSLFEYYRKQGYTEVFDHTQSSISIKDIDLKNEHETDKVNILKKDDDGKWFHFFDKKLRQRSICVLHSQTDFNRLLEEYPLSGGQVVCIADDNEDPSGIAFIANHSNRVVVKELIATNTNAESALLRSAALLNNTEHLYYTKPSSQRSNTKRYGMGIILNREYMIKQWLKNQTSSTVKYDELMVMDSGDLTNKLMNYPEREAYFSLMLD
ncbi:GNAT family N-acetyltransferase [Parabacteroides sp. OttesenSCG-928-G07]|nr:GNAT family N-acetyltransferase [Parabacteroides sp. OttesenSCG-928-G21]MDL2278592.1 GNAT family N-acetyltransferase [Parabacteroides sp. OttesenSCG-928-G07]